MPAATHPIASRYLEELRGALAAARIATPEAADIEREIASHLAEAAARGESLDAVLRRLGSPRELAAAYGVELLFQPRPGARGSLARRAVAAGTRAVAALLLAVLGLTGATLAAAGALGAVAALVAPLLPLEPTLRAGPPQAVALVVALAVTAIGALLLRLFLFSLRLWRRPRPAAPSTPETTS
jgi:hypothetical protein